MSSSAATATATATATTAAAATSHAADIDIATAWFDDNPAPTALTQITTDLHNFLKHQNVDTDRIVLITSGGTIVPLEQNMVRFIDNFSTGNRGAASAEYFLSNNYTVIFLSRTGCAQPYSRHLTNTLHTSYIDTTLLQSLQVTEQKQIVFNGEMNNVITAIQTYQDMITKHRLHIIPFTTIQEYLYYLRVCTTSLQPWSSRAILYSAAAVSDFSLSIHQQVTHKIQSREGPLQLTLPQTPKMLLLARHIWVPHAYIISFKLETDLNILMHKAEHAMKKYGTNVVVANELHTRADKVIVVLPSSRITVTRPTNGELDTELIRTLVEQHTVFIKEHATG